jgi:hypothetical protein
VKIRGGAMQTDRRTLKMQVSFPTLRTPPPLRPTHPTVQLIGGSPPPPVTSAEERLSEAWWVSPGKGRRVGRPRVTARCPSRRRREERSGDPRLRPSPSRTGRSIRSYSDRFPSLNPFQRSTQLRYKFSEWQTLFRILQDEF